MDEACAATHGIEGKTTSIAEHVQDTLPLRVAFKQGAVLTLVDEESCLLPVKPVDME